MHRTLTRSSRCAGATRRSVGLAGTLVTVVIAVLARPALAAGAPPDDVPVLSATPGQPLRFSVGDTVEVGRVTREGITEGDISLRRSPGRLEGRVGGEPIDVRL